VPESVTTISQFCWEISETLFKLCRQFETSPQFELRFAKRNLPIHVHSVQVARQNMPIVGYLRYFISASTLIFKGWRSGPIFAVECLPRHSAVWLRLGAAFNVCYVLVG